MFTGRVVRKREPVWLPEDVELALEWQRDRDDHCSGCHQRRELADDPKLADQWRAVANRCHACAAAGREAQRISEEAGDSPDTHGLSFYVIREEDRRGRPHRQGAPSPRGGPVEQGR